MLIDNLIEKSLMPKDKTKKYSKTIKNNSDIENTRFDKPEDSLEDKNKIKYFLKSPQPLWYEQYNELSPLDSEEILSDSDLILKKKEEARILYEKYAEEFEQGL